MTVTERILELIYERRLKFSEISEKTGIDKASFTRWKNKDYKPSIDAIMTLAYFFDVSADYLLFGEERPHGNQPTAKKAPRSDALYDQSLNEIEMIMLDQFRALDSKKRIEALKHINNLSTNQSKSSNINDEQ
jgi:transcriptional regulator with XRE-family HTH domain